ncbi:MAG: efflux RND transporter periplasmic adaptor subunit [Betaproteobacteria bacterium]|nr:efflux RND transporter periplasmic adaptor subunit [Betaproteobacteria bacterium]
MQKKILSYTLRIGIVLVLAAAGWYLWQTWNAKNVKSLDERFEIETVKRGDIRQTVTANGTINPVVIVNVGTQVSGTVKKLHADFNDSVSQGQVLLELDPTLFRANVEQSRGNVANAQASYRLAVANEKRMRELFDQEYVTRQDLDQAVQAREAAVAQKRTAEGQLARDEANLRYSIIRSPVSGVVVSRQVDVGQTVAASFQTPTLFQIAQDLRRMQIDTNVAEADIGKVKVGQTVDFTVDAFPGRTFVGKVHQIRLSPIIQQNVVTYDAVVSVDNSDLSLLPGMTAYISVVVDSRDDVPLVPAAALRFRPPADESGAGPDNGHGGTKAGSHARMSGPRVFVVRGDSIAPVSVELGITDGRNVEITGGGLKTGDRVVVQNKASGSRNGSTRRMRVF